MEKRDGEGWMQEKRGEGLVGEHKNVCPGLRSWNSAMDRQVTAVFRTSGVNPLSHLVQEAPDPPTPPSSPMTELCFPPFPASITAFFKSRRLHYVADRTHLCARARGRSICSAAENTALGAQTHADTSEFPVQPCRQSFRAVAAG